jgi:hypothetical protein
MKKRSRTNIAAERWRLRSWAGDAMDLNFGQIYQDTQVFVAIEASSIGDSQ